MPETDPDSDILELCDNGEMCAAMARLIQRHGEAVHRYCRWQLRDVALADDVQQQIFIAAYQDLSTFRRQSSIRTWLFAIARRRVLKVAKSRRRRTMPEVALAEAIDMDDPRPLPFESLHEERQRRLLDTRIAELPEEMRTTVLLRYRQGFTFEEMAEILGERPGTLQARCARAVRQLRVAIESQ